MKFNAGCCGEVEVNMEIVISAISAIEKAVSEDVPNELREKPLETNNRSGPLRGDWINQNLRDFTANTGGILHPFSRFGWRGRMILDPENKVSYSITTISNLKQIPRKARKNPHFLQTVLMQENRELYCRYEQTSLFETDQFDQSVYDRDFDSFFYGSIDQNEGYKHCVICYEAAHDEVLSVSLLLLDPHFHIVNEMDLGEFRKPDFSKLTADDLQGDYSTSDHNKAVRTLIKLKHSLSKIGGQSPETES